MSALDATAMRPRLVPLDSDESERILTRAAESGDMVELTAAGRRFKGRIRAMSADEIELLFGEAADLSGIEDALVSLTTEHGVFEFESHVRNSEARPDGVSLTLDTPATLTAVQRRRFWRATLHASAPVKISGDGGAIASGVVLNISPAGLACRVSAGDVEALPVGSRVTVEFTLEADAQPFVLSAQLKATTPASKETEVVARFQFLCDDASVAELTRLRLATQVRLAR